MIPRRGYSERVLRILGTLLVPAGLGLVLSGTVLTVAVGEAEGVWAIPVGICAAILGGILLGLSGSGRKSHALGLRRGNTQQAVDQARADGRLALARIDAVTDTGVKVDGDALMDVELTVQPTTRSAFRTRARTLVSPGRAASFVVGQRHVVALLSNDGPELTFTEDSPESLSWARRPVPDADFAGPLLKARRGKVAVDGSVIMARGGPGGAAAVLLRGLRLVMALVIMLAAAGAVAYPYREPLAQSVESLQQGRLHPDLRQPQYLEAALRKISADVGHTDYMQVNVAEDYLAAEAPLRPGQKASDDWRYSNGVVSHRGPSTIQPESAGEAFKLTDVAWEKMWPAMQRAAEQSGLPLESATLAASRSMTSSVSPDGKLVKKQGAIRVSINLSDDYRSAYFTINASGTGLKRTDTDG